MWTKRPKGPASERTFPVSPGRRRFLAGMAGAALVLGLPLRRRLAFAQEAPGKLPSGTVDLLEKSGFVYVSPLKPDGSESTCHGEVWYGWLDGAVVLVTSSESWKARSFARGLKKARIWVGDHGRWKRTLGRNEAFREAPSFDAQVSRSEDTELLDRLMKLYGGKYPGEIAKWEPRFREGFASGERVLLRYAPISS
jgi:hypothetical protein